MVPFIVRWPGHTEEGTVTDRLVSQIDVFRSLAGPAGAELPEGAAPDSRVYSDCDYVIEMSNNHTISIRDAQWKYISPSDGAPMITWGPKIETGYRPYPQLFSLSDDRGETENVAESHQDVVERLQTLLDAELSKGTAYPQSK